MALAQSSYDPLSEFASEHPAEPELERFSTAELSVRSAELSRADSAELSRAAAWPPLVMPQVSSPATRAPGRRWVVGTVMLFVGLAAGFACAVAVVALYGDAQTWRRILDLSGAQSGARPIEVQQGHEVSEPIELSMPVAPVPPARTERSVVDPGPVIPPGSVAVLYVRSRPMGADVYLDDQLITTTPFQLSDIALGPHTIRIEMPGYRPWSESITVEVGSRIAISAALEQ